MTDQMRYSYVLTKKLTSSIGTTPALPFHDYAATHLQTPSLYSSSVVTVFTSSEEAGTYTALVDSAGTAVTIAITTNRTYDFPVACFGSHWVKLLVDNAADNTRDVILMFKT